MHPPNWGTFVLLFISNNVVRALFQIWTLLLDRIRKLAQFLSFWFLLLASLHS